MTEERRPFFNIAHRGARAFAPENTLPAVRMARRLGANVVELDVQMSRDGELIVFHDDDLRRCSDSLSRFPARTDYSVSAHTWAEISVLDAGTWYAHELARPPRERQAFLQDLAADEVERWMTAADVAEYGSGTVGVPRLREALVIAHECELAVILDIKTIPRRYPAIAGKVISLIRDLRMEAETLISSFDHALLADIRREGGTIATGVLTAERLHRPRDYVTAIGADAFEPGCAGAEDVIRRGVAADDVDVDAIRDLTDAGLLVNVWTENAGARMRALIEAGVTGIFTDYPNRLARVLADIGRAAPIRPAMTRRAIP